MQRISPRVLLAALVLLLAGGAVVVALMARPRLPAPSRTPQTESTPVAGGSTTAPPSAAPVASTDIWEYCGAIGSIDQPGARYLGDGTRAVIQDVLAVAERLPQRFADPAARRVAIPWRCMGGAVWACDPGANLPCGRANTSRDPSAGMSAYCAEHPDGILPAFVSRHETIYTWSCRGGQAVIDSQPFQADERGFVANFWYRLDRPR